MLDRFVIVFVVLACSFILYNVSVRIKEKTYDMLFKVSIIPALCFTTFGSLINWLIAGNVNFIFPNFLYLMVPYCFLLCLYAFKSVTAILTNSSKVVD